MEIDQIGKDELLRRVDKLEKRLIEKRLFAQRHRIAPDVVALIREIIAEKKLDTTSADSLLMYMEPMVKDAGKDRKTLETIVLTCNFLWKLSTVRNPNEVEKGIQFFVKKTGLVELGDTADFREVPEMMRKRRKVLFPSLHEQKTQAG